MLLCRLSIVRIISASLLAWFSSVLARVESVAHIVRSREGARQRFAAVRIFQAASHRLALDVRLVCPFDHSDTCSRRHCALHHLLICRLLVRNLCVVAWGRLLSTKLLLDSSYSFNLLLLWLEATGVLWIERAVCASKKDRHILVRRFYVKHSLFLSSILRGSEVANLIEKLFSSYAPHSLKLLQR